MSEAQGSPPQPPQRDPWGIWFSRLVQVVGLAAFVHELLLANTQRPWLLLVVVAMMLGGLGLQLVLRWALERVGGPP